MQKNYLSRTVAGVVVDPIAGAHGQVFPTFLLRCMLYFFLGVTALVPLVAHAGTFYKCTDGSGKILFTNTQQQGSKTSCTVLSQQRDPPGATTLRGYRDRRPRAAATPTPGDFPRVSGNEQRARDGDRRIILEKELNSELENLAKAQRLAATAGSSPGAQVPRDTVALHERNIKAIQREIANLR
mgnify:CR=1 FL=1|jgi:hypothetical protein